MRIAILTVRVHKRIVLIHHFLLCEALILGHVDVIVRRLHYLTVVVAVTFGFFRYLGRDVVAGIRETVGGDGAMQRRVAARVAGPSQHRQQLHGVSLF